MNKQELEALAMEEIPLLEEKVRRGFEHWAPTRYEEWTRAWNLSQKLKEHHPLKYAHSLRTGLKSEEILIFTHFLPRTGLYGMFHDIGVLKTPIKILDKAWGIGEPYTPEDHEEITKKHPWDGYEILMENGLLMTAWIALLHHRFDINDPYPIQSELPPYPKELESFGARLNVMFNSRIVSLADQYDAFHRPNIPLTPQEIKRKMITKNPDQIYLVSQLYEAGIFV